MDTGFGIKTLGEDKALQAAIRRRSQECLLSAKRGVVPIEYTSAHLATSSSFHVWRPSVSTLIFSTSLAGSFARHASSTAERSSALIDFSPLFAASGVTAFMSRIRRITWEGISAKGASPTARRAVSPKGKSHICARIDWRGRRVFTSSRLKAWWAKYCWHSHRTDLLLVAGRAGAAMFAAGMGQPARQA
jgi:hypothetical protein